MTSKEMVKIAYEALSDKKGQDIKIIDIQLVSVLADYFIIADGSNVNQVQAMADNVEEMLAKVGCECRQIEGYQSGNWILMDYGDCVAHVFLNEERDFYNLEQLWADAPSEPFMEKEENDRK